MQSKSVYTNLILTVIALLLGIIALRPALQPSVVSAQTGNYSYLYIEPRVFTLRRPDGMQQVQGKVAIDMRNGDVWGFPTLTEVPYPVDTTTTKPPVSPPMYLGRFDFAKIATTEKK